jgi:heme-degrading monooxygenase HmoA
MLKSVCCYGITGKVELRYQFDAKIAGREIFMRLIIFGIVLVLALTCAAFFAVQGSKEVKSGAVIGLHIVKLRTEAEGKEIEQRIKDELIPDFIDVPGVIAVNMIKALWDKPLIGAMIVFESQEAQKEWWNGLSEEEKQEQKKTVEEYKDILIVSQDFSIVPNEK